MTQSVAEAKATPMMLQWQECKKTAKDALLLFRMGDFYEAFYNDAALISKECELALTSRQGIPMSGVPYHTCESYIDKLVAKGYRVAVAEQTSDPKSTKGLVRREVVRVVTPGTVINSSLLPEKSNNFFASLSRVGSIFGLAYMDLTTADFRVCEFKNERDLVNDIHRLRPAEFLAPKKFITKHAQIIDEISQAWGPLMNEEEDWRYEHQTAYDALVSHFQVHSLDGFGMKGMTAGINSAGALLNYLQEGLHLPVGHITEIQPYTTCGFMALDKTTQRNLELTRSMQDGSRRNTLLEVLDYTKTAMGARLIQQWIKQPLLQCSEIALRQRAVGALIQNEQTLHKLRSLFENIKDIERIMMKISADYAIARDLVALRFSLEPIEPIKQILSESCGEAQLIKQLLSVLDSCPDVTKMIAEALVDEPPAKMSDGNFIKQGFHDDLDMLKEISRNSKAWLANYQAQLKEETGIKTLKVGYNKMFGYYIEVSKGQTNHVPATFHRRQTLVNAERYLTPELKDYEQKVLTAQEKISSIEAELFHALRQKLASYSRQVLKVAQAVAYLDCLQSLAEAARRHNYSCPIVDDSLDVEIIEGKHPVIESARCHEAFTANDTFLDGEKNQLMLITGPNMAGKSTYLRQVALICIMAQIGSYVPAKQVRVGMIDKVFTRIGASDDLSMGQSTFMVEMNETANILNNATSRSLVILDEIGRGTSTYDGIAIAWSVAEYLLTEEGRSAKTLFATHYWELTQLQEKMPGAVNYNVAVHERNGSIVFLRKIIRGGTDKSYGIHVARLAGLPLSVIQRAKDILSHLEETRGGKETFSPSRPQQKKRKKNSNDPFQLTFFSNDVAR